MVNARKRKEKKMLHHVWRRLTDNKAKGTPTYLHHTSPITPTGILSFPFLKIYVSVCFVWRGFRGPPNAHNHLGTINNISFRVTQARMIGSRKNMGAATLTNTWRQQRTWKFKNIAKRRRGPSFPKSNIFCVGTVSAGQICQCFPFSASLCSAICAGRVRATTAYTVHNGNNKKRQQQSCLDRSRRKKGEN